MYFRHGLVDLTNLSSPQRWALFWVYDFFISDCWITHYEVHVFWYCISLIHFLAGQFRYDAQSTKIAGESADVVVQAEVGGLWACSHTATKSTEVQMGFANRDRSSCIFLLASTVLAWCRTRSAKVLQLTRMSYFHIFSYVRSKVFYNRFL